MNIPEWQSKMLKSSPKTIMKHVTREIELLTSGGSGARDELHKQITTTRTVVGDDKKVRKYNIDIHTGKRKYTKKLKLDGNFVNVKRELTANFVLQVCFIVQFLTCLSLARFIHRAFKQRSSKVSKAKSAVIASRKFDSQIHIQEATT